MYRSNPQGCKTNNKFILLWLWEYHWCLGQVLLKDWLLFLLSGLTVILRTTFCVARPTGLLILSLHQMAESQSTSTCIIFKTSLLCIFFVFWTSRLSFYFYWVISYKTQDFLLTSQTYYRFLIIPFVIHFSFLKWRYLLHRNVIKNSMKSFRQI